MTEPYRLYVEAEAEGMTTLRCGKWPNHGACSLDDGHAGPCNVGPEQYVAALIQAARPAEPVAAIEAWCQEWAVSGPGSYCRASLHAVVARLVRAEREACAQIAESWGSTTLEQRAAAIRARGAGV